MEGVFHQILRFCERLICLYNYVIPVCHLILVIYAFIL